MLRRAAVHGSILWRVFTVNAIVFGVAVLALIVAPVTIHAQVRLTELMLLMAGLLLTLLIDLALLRMVLSPVRRLASLMGDIDPLRPGQRAPVGEWASAEASMLARAFNKMLDRVETERRESARRALAAQEAERLRIARELHDEIGQTLTAVALQAERAAVQGVPQTGALQEITATLHHSLDDVRRIARELRPEALDDLGLIDALIGLCMRVERSGSMMVRREFEVDLPVLSAEAELVLYRVAQEALTNAMRHSGASEVSLGLARREDRVLLSVTDDGCGLPVDSSAGDGLAGMRERAMLIQAQLALAQAPGGGLRVELAVPAGGVPG